MKTIANRKVIIMSTVPIIVEQLMNATPGKVWAAITDVEEMKHWYFHLHEFKPEVGFIFQFTGGTEEGIKYLHVCEVTEAITDKKLTYSWSYEGYEGITFVTFEILPQENHCIVRLTHSGLENLPADNPDFAVSNFEKGWTEIINHSLADYLNSSAR